MTSTLHPARLGTTLAFLSTLALGLSAQTTVVVPCNLDNTLYQDLSGTTSNGKGVSVFVGQTGIGDIRRAVLRFNIAGSVPTGASIVSAVLSLRVAQTTASVPLAVDAHRVLQAWGEGNSIAGGGGGGGTVAATGDATWLHSLFSTTFWTNLGGDFVASPSFAMSAPTSGAFASSAGPGTVADVQFWLNNPASNFGWLVKAQSESAVGTARRIDSRETTTGSAPTLTVSYLMPGQAGVWGTGCPSGAGTFNFAFGGAPIGGSTVQLLHTNGPPNALGANFFALELDQVGLPLLPGCTAYWPLTSQLILINAFFFDGAGFVSSPWTVPTSLPGLYFMSQSVALENNALGLIVSNAGVAVIQ